MFPSLFMGLVGPGGAWETYDGTLRFTDHAGRIVAECHDMSRYQEFIGEAVEADSYLKSPYFRPAAILRGFTESAHWHV